MKASRFFVWVWFLFHYMVSDWYKNEHLKIGMKTGSRKRLLSTVPEFLILVLNKTQMSQCLCQIKHETINDGILKFDTPVWDRLESQRHRQNSFPLPISFVLKFYINSYCLESLSWLVPLFSFSLESLSFTHFLYLFSFHSKSNLTLILSQYDLDINSNNDNCIVVLFNLYHVLLQSFFIEKKSIYDTCAILIKMFHYQVFCHAPYTVRDFCMFEMTNVNYVISVNFGSWQKIDY